MAAAGRDGTGGLAVSAVSGRVVAFLHDDTPHLRLVADSIA